MMASFTGFWHVKWRLKAYMYLKNESCFVKSLELENSVRLHMSRNLATLSIPHQLEGMWEDILVVTKTWGKEWCWHLVNRAQRCSNGQNVRSNPGWEQSHQACPISLRSFLFSSFSFLSRKWAPSCTDIRGSDTPLVSWCPLHSTHLVSFPLL